MTSFEAAVDVGRALGKTALYFGCWQRAGHYLHDTHGRHLDNYGRDERDMVPPDFPAPIWLNIMDGGLLKNGRHPDIYDGKVFWTCGGAKAFWYAFYWWDNSIDRRGASNSGFYVRGFGWPKAQEAFDYACSLFPTVTGRQWFALVLQDPLKGKRE
jgi:hypothetical protein